jgi:hypothetical protein
LPKTFRIDIYNMSVLLEDFNAKINRDYGLKPKVGNETFLEISNYYVFKSM